MVTSILDQYFQGERKTLRSIGQDFAYNSMRGVIVPVLTNGFNNLMPHAVVFQFNPDTISYQKQNNYGSHERIGHKDSIPYWQNGGARIINFKLHMEGTAGAQFKTFKGSGSVSGDGNSSAYINYNDWDSVDNNRRGLLDEIEKLEALQYPLVDTGKDRLPTTFINGIPKHSKQFTSTPRIILSFGSLYAEGYLINLSRTDVLMNKYLNPIRSEFDVTISVDEARVVDTNVVIRPTEIPQGNLNNRNNYA
jgi:hypothetical protein